MTSRRFSSSFCSAVVNNAAIPKFASSQCVSHQQFTLCIWWIVVLTLRSLNGWNEKDTHQRMFAMLSSLTWGKKKKRYSVKTSLASIYPAKLEPPGVVCARKEHLDWSWFNVVTTFYNPLKTRLKRKRTASKCKENIQIILFILFRQNKVSRNFPGPAIPK